MSPSLEILALAQYAITALSSGFNAVFFWSYRSPERRRRIGAAVLTVVCLATLVQSLYFGLFFLLYGQSWSDSPVFGPRPRLMVESLVCLGSILISALVLRQMRLHR